MEVTLAQTGLSIKLDTTAGGKPTTHVYFTLRAKVCTVSFLGSSIPETVKTNGMGGDVKFSYITTLPFNPGENPVQVSNFTRQDGDCS